jgi:hypothetical protein
MEELRIQRWVVVEGLQSIAEVRDAGRFVGDWWRKRVPEPLVDAGTLRVDEEQADDLVRVCLREQDRHRRTIRVDSDLEGPADAGGIKQRTKGRRPGPQPSPGAVIGPFVAERVADALGRDGVLVYQGRCQ